MPTGSHGSNVRDGSSTTETSLTIRVRSGSTTAAGTTGRNGKATGRETASADESRIGAVEIAPPARCTRPSKTGTLSPPPAAEAFASSRVYCCQSSDWMSISEENVRVPSREVRVIFSRSPRFKSIEAGRQIPRSVSANVTSKRPLPTPSGVTVIASIAGGFLAENTGRPCRSECKALALQTVPSLTSGPGSIPTVRSVMSCTH